MTIKTFKIFVYDNFHDFDDDGADEYGEYETVEEALSQAKVIVEKSLKGQWKIGISETELILSYMSFGDSPDIMEGNNKIEFSGRKYAYEILSRVFSELSNQ